MSISKEGIGRFYLVHSSDSIFPLVAFLTPIGLRAYEQFGWKLVERFEGRFMGPFGRALYLEKFVGIYEGDFLYFLSDFTDKLVDIHSIHEKTHYNEPTVVVARRNTLKVKLGYIDSKETYILPVSPIACGVGDCFGCPIKLRSSEDYAMICRMGPLFNLKEVEV